jgi:hypothetical protein
MASSGAVALLSTSKREKERTLKEVSLLKARIIMTLATIASLLLAGGAGSRMG